MRWCRTFAADTTNWRSRSGDPAGGRRVRRAGRGDVIRPEVEASACPCVHAMQQCQCGRPASRERYGRRTWPKRQAFVNRLVPGEAAQADQGLDLGAPSKVEAWVLMT